MKSLRTANLNYLLVLFISVNFTFSYTQTNHKQLTDSAAVALDKMNYQSALFFLEDALILSKKSNQTSLIVNDLLRIGDTHMSLDNMDSALENYLLALRLSESTQDDSLEFEVITKISFYFMEFEQLEMAEEYVDRAKKLANKLHHAKFYSSYYNSLGILERRKKNFEASIQAYKQGLELIPSTLPEEKFSAFVNLSTAYAYGGNLQTSYTYLLRAEELNESLQNDWYSLVLYGQLGRTNLLLGNPDKAIEYYILGLEVSNETQNHDMIERFNRELARAHAKLGNYRKAYEYYAAFVIELQNSQERENASAIAEMSAKYEHEKNEQRIKSLEKQRELKAEIHKSQIDRRNLWIIFFLLIVCITIFAAFLVLKNQRNKQRLRLELVENQKELVKQQSELKGQEVERNRLSRELHDGLGGTLASIKMRLSSKNIESISPILKDLDTACQDVRNMSHSLSSSFINETSFYSLLMKLSEDIQNRSSLIVNLEFMPMEELNNLESEKRHQCYRIIQELSNNVLKHAHAKTLTIGLMKNDDEVILLVEDDGIGFDAAAAPSGIGLNNVSKRLENIGGHLEIMSKQNGGSTFSIDFPFNKRV